MFEIITKLKRHSSNLNPTSCLKGSSSSRKRPAEMFLLATLWQLQCVLMLLFSKRERWCKVINYEAKLQRR